MLWIALANLGKVAADDADAPQQALNSYMQGPEMSSLSQAMATNTDPSAKQSISQQMATMVESFVVNYSGPIPATATAGTQGTVQSTDVVAQTDSEPVTSYGSVPATAPYLTGPEPSYSYSGGYLGTESTPADGVTTTASVTSPSQTGSDSPVLYSSMVPETAPFVTGPEPSYAYTGSYLGADPSSSSEVPSTAPFQTGAEPTYSDDGSLASSAATTGTNAFTDSQNTSVSSLFMTATATNAESSVASGMNSVDESAASQPTPLSNGTYSGMANRILPTSAKSQSGLATDGAYAPQSFSNTTTHGNSTGNSTTGSHQGSNNSTNGSGEVPIASASDGATGGYPAPLPSNGAGAASFSTLVGFVSVLGALAVFM